MAKLTIAIGNSDMEHMLKKLMRKYGKSELQMNMQRQYFTIEEELFKIQLEIKADKRV